MKCWHCETELIWGADHDVEDDDTYDTVTNLHCPKCYCVSMFIIQVKKQ